MLRILNTENLKKWESALSLCNVLFCFVDLLTMKENSGARKDPVGYPRNEWFYLNDNAMEDDEEKRKNEM